MLGVNCELYVLWGVGCILLTPVSTLGLLIVRATLQVDSRGGGQNFKLVRERILGVEGIFLVISRVDSVKGISTASKPRQISGIVF